MNDHTFTVRPLRPRATTGKEGEQQTTAQLRAEISATVCTIKQLVAQWCGEPLT